MVTVKLYGLLSEYGGQRQFSADVKTVRQALKLAADMGADQNLLHGALLFVNGRPLTGIRRLSCKLTEGDELALLSPAGGG